jgi:Ca-activated chloride channel family protein
MGRTVRYKTWLFPGLLTLAFLYLGGPEPVRAQSARKKVAEGNRHYEDGRYDEASNCYQDALLDQPESPRVHFNVGNVLYKKKKYEQAVEAFMKALKSESDLSRAESYYNLGNTAFRRGNLPEAIEHYEMALTHNPEDMDAKYNLEFVRNQLKQNSQPQDQQSQDKKEQPDSQQQKDESGQQSEQERKDQSREPQSGEDQQEARPESGQEEGEQEPQDSGDSGKEEGEQKAMSRAQAEQLLNSLNEDPEKLQRARKMPGKRVRVAKDW